MPTIIGMFVNHLIINPLKSDANQNGQDLLVFVFFDWVVGLIIEKVLIIMILLAPEENEMRNQAMNVYINNEPNFFNLLKMCLKILHWAVLLYVVPYFLVGYGLNFVFKNSYDDREKMRILAITYPTLLIVGLGGLVAKWQLQWIQSILDKLKQDSYMVTNRLINRNENNNNFNNNNNRLQIVPPRPQDDENDRDAP